MCNSCFLLIIHESFTKLVLEVSTLHTCSRKHTAFLLAVKGFMNCLEFSRLLYCTCRYCYLLMLEAEVMLEVQFLDAREEGGW